MRLRDGARACPRKAAGGVVSAKCAWTFANPLERHGCLPPDKWPALTLVNPRAHDGLAGAPSGTKRGVTSRS